MLQKMGYTRSDVIGKRSTEFLTEDSRRYVVEVVLPDYLKTGNCIDILLVLFMFSGIID